MGLFVFTTPGPAQPIEWDGDSNCKLPLFIYSIELHRTYTSLNQRMTDLSGYPDCYEITDWKLDLSNWKEGPTEFIYYDTVPGNWKQVVFKNVDDDAWEVLEYVSPNMSVD